MTEAASRGRRRGGAIGLAYVVTRWLFIDRFPRRSRISLRASGTPIPLPVIEVVA